MSAEKPLVSVVVPSYNHEKFVRQCIESIINQTYKNIELFVIDDGSKDNTSVILKELSEKYKFYFERQENRGVINTTNKLLKMCKGKYISILASDDAWLPDKLEKQVAFMEQNLEISACFGNELSIDAENNILPPHNQTFIGYKEYFFEDIISFNAYIAACTNLYRKEVFEKLGYYNPDILLEDLYLHLKMTDNKMRIVVLPHLLTYYRRHGNNFSNKSDIFYYQKMKLLEVYKDKPGYKSAVLKTRYHYYTDILMKIIPKKLFPFRKK